MIEMRLRVAPADIALGKGDVPHYINDFDAEILIVEEGDLVPVGTIHFSVVKLGKMMADDENPVEMMGSRFDVFCRALIGESGALRNGLVDESIMALDQGDLMVVRLVDIDRGRRGLGYGLLALDGLIDGFHMGCSIVTLQISPMQFIDRAGVPDSYGLSESAARDKLSSHYARIGFRRVPQTDVMFASPLFARPLV